ncbi:phosphoglucomutase [Treponema parvum]|uniref:Phosphoglucomutase n=1 Tax=Treponema parvum TaxID=138851 RepID=A0A975F283_9SPIR|nr:hypothetical protein [Treponema parvum]QTQ12759.1 phosphoglucomutase [Treponema parvum]QTQ13018.1 phosphoglucomutase [Treponema parvum]
MNENFDLNLSMFKAYDIRTRSGKMTSEVSERLLKAAGRYFKDDLKVSSVVLGRDARLAAPGLLQEASDLFTSIGLDVILNPLQISTCQFYFSCMKHRKSAAIMFTASHNPGEYIGLKLMAPDMFTLATDCGPKGGIRCIKEYYVENKEISPSKQKGKVIVSRVMDEFIDYSMRFAGVEKDSLNGVPVLVDFLSGAAGCEIVEALTYAGCSVTPRNIVPNGYFPNGDPNPIIISSIKPTWDIMKKGGYDFGFCYDGDGDRLDIMNRDGEQLAPAFNMTLLAPKFKEIYRPVFESGFFEGSTYNPHLYSDVKANPLSMYDQCREGFNVHIIRNGHSFIKEALRTNLKRQYIVASEESAHYYLNQPFDLNDYSKGFAATENTLLFTLLTANMWAKYPEKYEKIYERQKDIFRIREWPCHFLDESKEESIMDDVENAMKDKFGVTVIKFMEDKSSLDATLMRYGLPEVITKDTDMSKPWFQVAQRISRSEEGMTRWEIVANNKEMCDAANALVRSISDKYVNAKFAEYV